MSEPTTPKGQGAPVARKARGVFWNALGRVAWSLHLYGLSGSFDARADSAGWWDWHDAEPLARRPALWDDPPDAPPWPLIETAAVILHDGSMFCGKCSARRAAVEVSDGVLTEEEQYVCAPCLLDAIGAYPEHLEGPSDV